MVISHQVSLRLVALLWPAYILTNINMRVPYLFASLVAAGIALGRPLSGNDQLESASEEVDKRFYYTHYEAPEKRDESLDKRFYYTRYEAPEKRDENLDKRFYYTNYEAPEKRDEEAVEAA